jgi:hypothetical protein
LTHVNSWGDKPRSLIVSLRCKLQLDKEEV